MGRKKEGGAKRRRDGTRGEGGRRSKEKGWNSRARDLHPREGGEPTRLAQAIIMQTELRRVRQRCSVHCESERHGGREADCHVQLRRDSNATPCRPSDDSVTGAHLSDLA